LHGAVVLRRSTIYTVLLLTVLFIILYESFNIPVVVAGIGLSILCVYICSRLIPLPKVKNLNYFRLFVYAFYLIGQAYLGAFTAIKLIITGANVQVAEVKTNITNNFLRTILGISITLTPCTILLELEGEMYTVLYIQDKKHDTMDPESQDEYIKGKLERMLIKAERQGNTEDSETIEPAETTGTTETT